MLIRGRNFKCPICGKIRERGSLIRIGKGSRLTGLEVKICMRGLCQKIAKKPNNAALFDNVDKWALT